MVFYPSLFLLLSLPFSQGSSVINLHSDFIGSRSFVSLSIDTHTDTYIHSYHHSDKHNESSHRPSQGTQRPAYVSLDDPDRPLYMYHVCVEPTGEGIGMWLINDKFGSRDSAIAYVESWAVMPHLVHAVNDNGRHQWHSLSEEGWVKDDSFVLECVDHDTTVYLDVTGFAWPLSGFYVQQGNSSNPLFSQVNMNTDKQFYLYKQESTWIIGENPSSDEGLAYVRHDATLPGLIDGAEWFYAFDNEWHALPTKVISGNSERNVYAGLRDHRSIDFLPESQSFFELRNGIVFPALGLGTGGIPLSITESVLLEAMRLGYRMFDMARQYGNEAYVGHVIRRSEADNRIPLREEVFITSKVWPTHLGVKATTDEVQWSLHDLGSAYVDMYLLHWPFCDPSVDWMHCEETVDSTGTWEQSWRTLERAYAEGKIMSIGVSNFDMETLSQLVKVATTGPHAVQNFAQVGELDLDMREWCSEHDVVYVPYATARNVDLLHEEWKEKLQIVAGKYGLSEHAAIYRFFMQTNAAVIPRATSLLHLRENINITKVALTSEDMTLLGWPYANDHNEL